MLLYSLRSLWLIADNTLLFPGGEMKKTAFCTFSLFLWIFLITAGAARAWHDETHLAVAKAAGYHKWYNAAGPDIAKEKAREIEGPNHYYNNNRALEVTSRMVLEQVGRYNYPNDAEGHLYGAIIASLRQYGQSKKEKKYAQYHIAFCAHYLADLSQPQHNTPRDDFNRTYHEANERVVNDQVLQRIGKIEKYMYPITLREEHFEEDLAKEIARIANGARKLDSRLRQENRAMTPEEVYRQLGHSASLLEAVLYYLKL